MSGPVLKGAVRKSSWQNFRDFCVIHENQGKYLTTKTWSYTIFGHQLFHGQAIIFIILIVSCIITLVAPSNLIIIASIGMEVYKSPLKFQADCIYTSQDIVFLKSWFSHTFVL